MLKTLGNTFSLFLWSGALALCLNVPLRRTEHALRRIPRRGIRRAAALALLLLGLAAALLAGSWLLLPQLLAAVQGISEALPQLAAEAAQLLAAAGVPPEWAESVRTMSFAGGGSMQSLWQTGVDAVMGAAGVLGRFFLALVLAVYLLAGKEELGRKGRRAVQAAFGAARAARLSAFAGRAAEVFSGFIAGQCIEACILAGLFVLALFLCRMPYVLPISAVIGVTALVPVFGSYAGCAFGMLLIASVSSEKACWFLVLFFAVQQFENNVIYPRVVGGRIGLPPLWVLIAVLLGGGVFGAAGLLLGIPAMSVLYHLGGEWVEGRLHPGGSKSAGHPTGNML